MHVGLQRAGDPHPGRALDGRGPLPRPEGRGRSRPTTPTTPSSPTSGCAPQPGTDGALAMAMGHVHAQRVLRRPQDAVLRPTTSSSSPTCRSWSGSSSARTARYVPGKFLTARGPRPARAATEDADVEDRAARRAHRRAGRARTARSATASASSGAGTVEPRPGRRRPAAHAARGPGGRGRSRSRCRASTRPTAPAACVRRGVPVRRVGGPAGHHRLRPAAGPVRRRPDGPARRWPHGLRRRRRRPAPRPGRRRSPACRPRRPRPDRAGSSRRTPSDSEGRSMIMMGAGTNHWFHSDTIYRAFLAADHAHRLPGRQRRRLGALRRPGEGPADHRLARAWRPRSDWAGPPRQMIGTAYWYLHTDQWRYDRFSADTLASPLGHGPFAGHAHRGHDGPVGAAGLDAVLPDVRPQPAGPGRRGRGRRRAAAPALRGRRAQGRAGCGSPARTPTRRRTGRGC